MAGLVTPGLKNLPALQAPAFKRGVRDRDKASFYGYGMVSREGVEPSVYLTWQIYSLLPSPTRHTCPKILVDPLGLEPRTNRL